MRTTTTALLMGLCSTLLWSQPRSPIPQVRHASESLPPEKLSTTLAEGQVLQRFSNPNASPAPAVCEWVGVLSPGTYHIAVKGTERWAPPVTVEKKGRTRCFIGASMKNTTALRVETMPIPSDGAWELSFHQGLSPVPFQEACGFEIVRVPPPPPPPPDEIIECDFPWRLAEQMPVFAGCGDLSGKEERKQCSDRKMMEFLSREFKYPPALKDWCGYGTIIVGFVIQKNGQIGEVSVHRGVHPLLDAEAVRVVQAMPAWTPGKQMGRPVSVQYFVPLRLRDQD